MSNSAAAASVAINKTPAPLWRATFGSALRGELLLSRQRLAVWASLGIWAGCITVFAYLVSYLSTASSPWSTPEQQESLMTAMLPQGTSYYILASLPLYGAPQFAILGAVIGSSDYARGTIGTILVRFPKRMPFAAARAMNLVIVAALTAVITLAASVLSSLALALFSGHSWWWPPLTDLGIAVLAAWLISLTFISFGFALGTLTRSTMAAVALAAGWVLGVESLLIGLLAPVLSFFDGIQGFLPVGATASLAASLVPAGEQVAPPMLAATSPGVAILVLLAWTALAGAVSAQIFRRRDLP